jgi:hypothetical protein
MASWQRITSCVFLFLRFGILQCKLVAVTVTQYYTLQPR